MSRAPLLVALLLVGSAPCAAALDLLDETIVWDATTARVLLRVPGGGALHVAAAPPVDVVVHAPGDDAARPTRTPADFTVGASWSWRGLDGVAWLVARRDSPEPVTFEWTDATRAGVAWTWPAATEEVPAPGPWTLAALAGASFARRQFLRSRRRA